MMCESVVSGCEWECVCVLPIYGHRLRRPGHHREEPYEAFLSKNISASRQIIES